MLAVDTELPFYKAVTEEVADLTALPVMSALHYKVVL